MKKELKEQIKRDELVFGFEHAVAWARAHQDELRIGIGVAVVVGSAVFALAYYRGSRARDGERALAEAVTLYESPVADEVPAGGEKPPGTVFPNRDEKYKSAAAAFDGVERRFGGQPVVERARYFAALCRIELGQYGDAEKALRAVAARREGNRLEPALARLAIADLLRRQGQVDKAVEEYRAIASDAALPVPRDFALMSLGETLEDAKRLAEAAATYKRLTEEFPASVYAAEARRKADYLQTAAQG